jgi:hypothetical protein
MEAGKPLQRIAQSLAVAVALSLAPTLANAANYRTQNFLIQAPTRELAKAVGDAAEVYRRDLAVHWLGNPIPPWPVPCPVRVIAGNIPAQGVTTYNRAPVRDFQMEVVGTPERILDSVLPHEVTHTVLATHFGRPLPRWADEGICTTVEHDAERSKHEVKLREFLASRRGIAMNRMFLLTEYPDDVLPLYAQGYSVCRFLIEQQGPQAFIQFLEGYMQHPSWTDNIRNQYGYESLGELQDYWLAWVSAGSGTVDRFVKANNAPVATPAAAAIASQETPASRGTAVDQLSPPLNSLANSTAGSNSAEAGWYLRRRMGGSLQDEAVIANQTIAQVASIREVIATPVPERDPSTQAPLKTSAPPSVKQNGFYSAAQPQPEQSFSGGDFSRQSYSAPQGYSAQSVTEDVFRRTPSSAPVEASPEPYYYGGRNAPNENESGHFWR